MGNWVHDNEKKYYYARYWRKTWCQYGNDFQSAEWERRRQRRCTGKNHRDSKRNGLSFCFHYAGK